MSEEGKVSRGGAGRGGYNTGLFYMSTLAGAWDMASLTSPVASMRATWPSQSMPLLTAVFFIRSLAKSCIA